MKDDKVADAMLDELTQVYVAEMRAMQPEGPYLLGGFCYGGKVAFEMAQHLRADGQKMDLLALLYTYLSNAMRRQGAHNVIAKHVKILLEKNPREGMKYLGTLVILILERFTRMLFPKVTRHFLQKVRSTDKFIPLYYPGRLTLFRPLEGEKGYYYEPKMGWSGLADELDIYEVPGNKTTMLQPPHVDVLAEFFNHSLKKAGN